MNKSLSSQDQTTSNLSLRLLGLIQELVTELHPESKDSRRVTLDASLDRELGIDSLGRVELLIRLERNFEVSLPDRLYSNAETPRDLLRIINAALESPTPEPAHFEVTPIEESGEAGAAPTDIRTLQDVLRWHAAAHGDRTHIYLYGDTDEPEEISYGELLQGSMAMAQSLLAVGLEPGRSVAIMLPTSRDYFLSFFAILFAGGIPVPIYPPARLSQMEDHLRRHVRILSNADATCLITVPEVKPVARLLRAQVNSLRQVITLQDLPKPSAVTQALPTSRSDDVAFLQYTSGSTGNPKGVILTHANLLANIRAMGEAAQVSGSDVFVSWLPLYHDMGLIGAWLGSLYFACRLVLMSPLAFLNRPRRWLWAIHNHRATMSAAPNFAYELCLNKLTDEDIAGLDLSTWRIAFNGAEPVSPRTIRRFYRRFSAYGLREEAITPVYGLAESSLGVTFPPLGRGPLIDRVRRDALAQSGKAVPTGLDDPSALEFVACGQPLRGHQVRIVDSLGRELPDRLEGRLQFRGPSTTSGYFRNPEATQRLFEGDWLVSGDLAYIADGEVFLTSREKDIIIRAGRNIYPYELEEAIGNLPGVRKGCVAVFGTEEADSGTERLVVLAETSDRSASNQERLRTEISALATDMLTLAPDEVRLVPPHSVLKTSSGKIRRAGCRELYEQGRIGESGRRVWIQLTRLAFSGLVSNVRRWFGLALDLGYAAYTWLLFLCLAPVVWLFVVTLPKAAWRWALIRKAARALIALARIPLRVQGLEHIPSENGFIIVSNHASYLDGIFLTAVLPGPFRFVAKGEFRGTFFARLFLQRIGSEFVERFDNRQGIEDAERISRVALSGGPLVFFPEGTMTRMPGLLPFHMGAFTVATDCGSAILPVTLRGTRSLLRSDQWFPRRAIIDVRISDLISPDGQGWSAAIALRDKVRREILRNLGEPDLESESGIQ